MNLLLNKKVVVLFALLFSNLSFAEKYSVTCTGDNNLKISFPWTENETYELALPGEIITGEDEDNGVVLSKPSPALKKTDYGSAVDYQIDLFIPSKILAGGVPAKKADKRRMTPMKYASLNLLNVYQEMYRYDAAIAATLTFAKVPEQSQQPKQTVQCTFKMEQPKNPWGLPSMGG